jgi:RNase P/RNase MRP subunit p29
MMRAVMLWVGLSIAVAALADGRIVQVTGPVLEVREDAIVIGKGKEKWEIARTPATVVNGELRKGARVTVEYTMSASKIEVREEKKR